MARRYDSKLSRLDAEIRRMVGDHIPASEIAQELDVSVQGLRCYCKREGIVIKPYQKEKTPRPAKARIPRSKKSPSERDHQMFGMYRQGLTLAKIGEQFGLTRERVRQILTGRFGANGKDGGASVRAAEAAACAKRSEAVRRLNREAKWGVDYELAVELRANGTIGAFEHQRQTAAMRGIEWALSFAQWYAVWQASGKIHLRGRGEGKYCMSRIKDSGPYALGNVHIQLSTVNSKEAVEKWRGKTKEISGVYCLYPGRDRAWLAKVGKVRLGYFTSAEAASAARESFLATHQKPARGRPAKRDAHSAETAEA